MRHLPVDEIQAALKRGKSVEQFLGRSPEHPAYIRHIELRPTDVAVEVWVYDSEDIGSVEQLDLYEFPSMKPDGPDIPVAIFEDHKSAIAYAASTLLAASNRWVNQFVVQDEYLEYIQSGRPANWPTTV